MLRGQLFLQELRACMHLCIVVSVTMRLFICASIRGSICSSLGRPTNLHIDRSMYVCMYTCVCVCVYYVCVCLYMRMRMYVCVYIARKEARKHKHVRLQVCFTTTRRLVFVQNRIVHSLNSFHLPRMYAQNILQLLCICMVVLLLL